MPGSVRFLRCIRSLFTPHVSRFLFCDACGPISANTNSKTPENKVFSGVLVETNGLARLRTGRVGGKTCPRHVFLHASLRAHIPAVKRLSACREYSNEDVLRTNEAARFAHREVLRLTPQSEVKRSAHRAAGTLHARSTASRPKDASRSAQAERFIAKSTCFRKCFLPGGD